MDLVLGCLYCRYSADFNHGDVITFESFFLIFRWTLGILKWTFHLVSDKSPITKFSMQVFGFSNDKIRNPVWDLMKISYFRISWPTL